MGLFKKKVKKCEKIVEENKDIKIEDKVLEKYPKPNFLELTQDEIDEIHSRGHITQQEKVAEWEGFDLCAPGDAIGSAGWRCRKFRNCHDCLIDYSLAKREYVPFATIAKESHFSITTEPIKLIDVYNLALENYQSMGVRLEPDKLLAMLLLPRRDEFEAIKVAEGEFYKAYKEKIDEAIEQVIRDFELTEEDIIQYVEAKGVCCDNYEHDKVWFVFAEGFGSMHWGLMYHKNKTPEEIFNLCYGSVHLERARALSLKNNK